MWMYHPVDCHGTSVSCFDTVKGRYQGAVGQKAGQEYGTHPCPRSKDLYQRWLNLSVAEDRISSRICLHSSSQ